MVMTRWATVAAALLLISPRAEAQYDTYCSVSADQFARLQPGMTYRDAISVIGCSGEMLSENEIDNHHFSQSPSMYGWRGRGSVAANMNVIFQNGRIVMKSQYGLR